MIDISPKKTYTWLTDNQKKFSTLLIMQEMQLKTTMRYHFIPGRMAIINKTVNNKVNLWLIHVDVRQKPTEYCKASQSFQFSHSVVSDSLRPHGLQHTRPPCPSPTPEVCSNSWNRVSDAIQPSHPLSSPSPPACNLSWHQGLFKWVSSSNQVANVLEF